MAGYKGFTSVELRKPTRSTFDLSHEKRLSSRIGKLTPIFISETMPNDTFYGSSEILIKLAPLIAPVFHRLNMYVHYFFVPNRLLWEDWETFITGGRLGAEVTSPPVPPYMLIDSALSPADSLLDTGSLADYLGVPPIPDADMATWLGDHRIAMMPFLSFYQVWFDYYRDRNYVPDTEAEKLPMASGNQAAEVGFLYSKYRCWQHDYFTSALPFTQRGAEVLLPIQGTGRMIDDNTGDPPVGSLYYGHDAIIGDASGTGFNPTVGASAIHVEIDNSEVSINEVRRAMRLQEWMERNALAGSRYNESIMAHFGRKTSDSRLQRAEYLGGGKAVVQISEVMTTAYSEDADSEVIPPASMSGRGSTYGNTNKFSYNCEEHGFVIGILSVMPTSSYMQGLPRMFGARNTFLEYPWPSFAHLGEQEVHNYEIFMNPASYPVNGNDVPLFGYQSRYADWKHIPSSTHGDFRSTLDYWHLTRKFSAQPTLSNAFVTYDDANQDRIFNVEGVDTLWMYIYNKINVKRSLPYFGTPQL